MLFEAHLFEELRFKGGVTQMNVSGQMKDRDAKGNAIVRPATAREWMAIPTHARTFAEKHGVRIFFIA